MRRVLVVDDNILDRKLISRKITIEFTDLCVKEATNGITALEMLLDQEFDLIITDLVMPKMEGIELIQNIKKLQKQIPIIAVSGENPYYLYMAKKIGVKKVFTKPIPENDFIIAIANLLGYNHKVVA